MSVLLNMNYCPGADSISRKLSPRGWIRRLPAIILFADDVACHERGRERSRAIPRCSKPTSLNNLPRINQRRQVETDDIRL